MAVPKRFAKRWMPKNEGSWVHDPPDTGSTDISWTGSEVVSIGVQDEDGGTGGAFLSQSELSPTKHSASKSPSSGEAAGRKLLSMIKGQEPPPSALRPEPQPLSMDEYQLWMMQAREDAEGGADELNAETFGEDHDHGWSFEENLLANDSLTQRLESEALSFQQAVDSRRKALGFALQEMSNFIEFKPKTLQKAVRSIINEGWSNITWHSGFTPFHLAAELDKPEILRLLFLVGGDMSVADVEGQRPIDIAKRCGHTECVDLFTKLLSLPSPHTPWTLGQAGQVPLPSFVSSGLATQIRQSVAQESSRDVERLKAALHEASKFFHIDPSSLQHAILHLLMTGSSFLPGSQSTITTVLHLAVELGRHDVIPMIVALGSNPFLEDWAGRTAMDVALMTGKSKCVEALHRCQLHQ